MDTSPAGLALTEIAHDNFREASPEAAAELLGSENWLEDDFPDEERAPDLGVPADDEPYREGSDERPPTTRPGPEIRFWNGKSTLEWEIRAGSPSLLDDDDAAAAVVQRSQTLDRIARGLAEYALVKQGKQIDLSANLLAIWEDLSVLTITNPSTGLEAATGGKGSDWSRSRSTLVGFPGGRNVPLAFFTWKDDADELIKRLAELEDLTHISAKCAKEKMRESGYGASTVGALFNWVRAAKMHPWIVAAHRARFRVQPEDYEVILSSLAKELESKERERLGSEGRRPPSLKFDRAPRVLYRALVGGIE